MLDINNALSSVKRFSGWVERRTTSALEVRQERAFATYGLWDGRRWRGGYGGPPFGNFREARLAWWNDLAKTMGDRGSEGVVLSRQQVMWLVRIAERPHPRPE